MIDFTVVEGGQFHLGLIGLYILFSIVAAVLTNKVLTYKGYEDTPGWIIAAVFFSLFVLIAAAGMPLSKDAHITKPKEQKLSKR